MPRILMLTVLMIACFIRSSGQQTVDTLTNNTVIQLKTAGLSDGLIKSKIQSSVCKFDLSTNGLIALKKAGISEDVMTAMLSKGTQTGNSSQNNYQSNTNTTATTSVDSSTKIPPGIYYCKGSPCDLIQLEASVYSQAKTGNGILTSLTYGIAKTKTTATLSGESSNMQIKDTKPVFYFYFDVNSSNGFGTNSNQMVWFTSASSPNEFLLVKFTAKKKNREVVTGSWSTYEGMSSGIDDDNKVKFRYEKLSPGVYKVFTEQPLKPGEYCFMYAGGTSVGYGSVPLQKVYDFGIPK